MAAEEASCSNGFEWVEMIEPESRQKVYANPGTGVILFEPPKDVPIKPMSDNQWWELMDSSSDTFYYHNPHTQETVWERPVGADIISLTRLQEVFPAGGQEDVDSNGTFQPLDKGLTEAVADVSNTKCETNVSSLHQDSTFTDSQQPPQNKRLSSSKVSSHSNKPEPLPKPVRKTSDLFSQPLESLSPLNVEYNGHRFSAFEPSIVQVENRGSALSSVGSASSVTAGMTTSNILNVASAGQGWRGSDIHAELSTRIGSKGTYGRSTLPKTRSAEYGSQRSTDMEGGGYYNSLGRDKSGTNLSNKSLTGYTHPRPPPTPPALPGMPRSASLMADPLEKFGDLAQHKRGFFRKKVTIANMLCWTKEPIKQPMILTRDKSQRKEAIDMFKLVLQFMGDRRRKSKDADAIALEVTSRAWQNKALADEVYIQLCRQTTANPKAESLRRGWELMTICLAFFPPTVKFRSYLEGYLWKHVDPSSDNKGVPVETFATYCHKRIEKMTQWGPKKGLKKPTLDEIRHAKTKPFQPSLFGTTVEETMEIQAEAHPGFEIPWIVVELCETVLRLQGPSTEGIFRVPGDIDEVNSLKLHVDKGNPPPPALEDPHIPASLLKLWFRELEEPLIPENYYQKCVDNCNHVNNILSLIDSLPDLNRKVLVYLIRFLQQFIGPENIQVTRMSIDNIAMVWAPNFLRCPSDDRVIIFENTRKEMSFMRLLIMNLNTKT